MEKKQGMEVEYHNDEVFDANQDSNSKLENSLLVKRSDEVFKQLKGSLDVSQIKSVIRSPTHFIFIFGFERRLISQVLPSSEILRDLAIHLRCLERRKEASSSQECPVHGDFSKARAISILEDLAEDIE